MSVDRPAASPPARAARACQSCSMPMKKDPQGGGTEADGSKSRLYCSLCYQHGRFTSPDLTVDEMQLLVRAKLKEMGVPGFLGGLFTRVIPKLERWRAGASARR